jgi:hypothetical protein
LCGEPWRHMSCMQPCEECCRTVRGTCN